MIDFKIIMTKSEESYFFVKIETIYNEITWINDLSLGDLKERIVKNYENGENIWGTGKAIYCSDIFKIFIYKSNVSYSELKINYESMKVVRRNLVIAYGFGNTPSDIRLGLEDVTYSFIRGNPGYKKLLNYTNRTEMDLTSSPNKIFIVHGHDNEIKESVARFIEKIGLEAIILHEKPNRGSNSIFSKLKNNSDVTFAVVLLSGDDYGYSKEESAKSKKLRARQNVIFELGYFLAHLGENKVYALKEDGVDFEMHSDFSGIVYGLYQRNNSNWKNQLSRELLAAGLRIDSNKLNAALVS